MIAAKYKSHHVIEHGQTTFIKIFQSYFNFFLKLHKAVINNKHARRRDGYVWL